jgi:murein tripeptide amidase MpaA
MLIFSKVRQTIQSCLVVATATFLLSTPPIFSQEKSSSSPTKSVSNENLKSLKTIAENSNYLATATEREVLDFLQKLDDASPYASQVSIGRTTEDRPIQSLIIAKEPKPILPLPKSDPRLVIVLLGGIHSGECDSKEALLALARDILAEATPKFLDHAVLVFVPNFNADGIAPAKKDRLAVWELGKMPSVKISIATLSNLILLK